MGVKQYCRMHIWMSSHLLLYCCTSDKRVLHRTPHPSGRRPAVHGRELQSGAPRLFSFDTYGPALSVREPGMHSHPLFFSRYTGTVILSDLQQKIRTACFNLMKISLFFCVETLIVSLRIPAGMRLQLRRWYCISPEFPSFVTPCKIQGPVHFFPGYPPYPVSRHRREESSFAGRTGRQ